MRFFDNIKRSLGFGPDIDPDDDDILADSPGIPQESESTASTDSRQADTTPDEQQLWAVLDGVIAIFNEAQPEFVRSCLSTEEQRRYAFGRLDQSLRGYLEGLAASTRRQCQSQFADQQASRNAETEHLRLTGDQQRQKIDELRQQLISTERQKRALADRVRDLETKTADFEAEREQADLLNRGLLNKIKVLGLQAGINPDELPDTTDQDTSALEAEIEKLKADNAQLKQQNESLNTDLSQLNDKCAMAQNMADGLRRRAAEAREQLEAKQAELDEAKKVVDGIHDLRRQMESVNEVIAKRDERIRQLKQQVAELEHQLAPSGATIDFNAPADIAAEPSVQRAVEQSQRPRRKPVATDAPTISDNDLAEIDRSFGYHPPKRTSVPDNDAQMSFDFD